MDVHLKALYTFTLQERRCIGYDRRIGCAKKFFHIRDLRADTPVCRGN